MSDPMDSRYAAPPTKSGAFSSPLSQINPDDAPEHIQHTLNAGCAEFLALFRQRSREALDVYMQAARGAFHLFRDAPGVDDLPNNTFFLGQLNALLELADLARSREVPENAVAMLRASEVAERIVRTVAEQGPMRVSDLADAMGKWRQNLSALIKELAEAGVIVREEIGRTVLVSASPMGIAALNRIPRDVRQGAAAGAMTRNALEQVAANAATGSEAIGRTAGGSASPMHVAAFNRVSPNRNVAAQIAAADSPAAATPRQPYYRFDSVAQMNFIVKCCHNVAAMPEHERAAAAGEAATEFENRFPFRVSGVSRQRLLEAFRSSQSHLLRDQDLVVVGSDPALYLPGVLEQLHEGLALNVRRYLAAGREMIQAKTLGGGASVQLQLLIEERQPAQLAGVGAAGSARW